MRVFNVTSDLSPYPEAQHEDPRQHNSVMRATLQQTGIQMSRQLCVATQVRDIRGQVRASTKSPDTDIYARKENGGTR